MPLLCACAFGFEHGIFEHMENKVNWGEFRVAMPLALGFLFLFLLLQKSGVIDLVATSQVNYLTAFLIGLAASVSTCMAVVGGLVLSTSASFAKSGGMVRSQALFHGGRLVSFFVLGGVIGFLGSMFQLGINGNFVLNTLVALILVILGINMLDIVPWVDRLMVRLPSGLGDKIRSLKNANHTCAPIIMGVITFFLPCGFTQSMQIYTLSTGDFWIGALTMFFFALGTLPVLLVLGLTSVSFQNKPWAGIFFKTAGIVVISFGLINLLNAFVVRGLISSFAIF